MSVAPIPADPIGKDFAEALGLPGYVTELHVSLKVHELGVVSCTYYPDEDALRRCLPILQRYALVPPEEAEGQGAASKD